MSNPSFGAVLSVYTQARTDPELYDAIHDLVVRHGSFVGQINRRITASFVDDPQRVALVSGLGTLAILAMQGLVVSHMVGASAGAKDDLIKAPSPSSSKRPWLNPPVLRRPAPEH
jgi:hypothetical protein